MNTEISRVYSAGVASVYANDMESQEKYLSIVGTEIRSISLETLKRAQCFFVPNNDYMSYYFSSEIVLPNMGCYLYDGTCVWHDFMVAPMYDVLGSMVGFAGFNPIEYQRTRDAGEKLGVNYYSYTTKDLMKKGNYMYGINGFLTRALRQGYLCLIDGFFDCLSLEDRGFISAALLASTVSMEIIAQLRLIKKVIFISDNDSAGVGTYSKLSKHLDNLVWVKQGITKDVDALLKTKYEKDFIEALTHVIESDCLEYFVVDFKRPKYKLK